MKQSLSSKKNVKNEKNYKRNLRIMKQEQQDKFERWERETDLRLCFRVVWFKLRTFLKINLVVLTMRSKRDECGRRKLGCCWMSINRSWRVCRIDIWVRWQEFTKRICLIFLLWMKFCRLIIRRSNLKRGTLIAWNLQEHRFNLRFCLLQK